MCDGGGGQPIGGFDLFAPKHTEGCNVLAVWRRQALYAAPHRPN